MNPWLLPLKAEASGEGQDRAFGRMRGAIRLAKPDAMLRATLRPVDTQTADAHVASGRPVAVHLAPVAATKDDRRATP